MFGLAKACHDQGRNSEAEAFYEQALPIWEKRLGRESRDFARHLYTLADLYHGDTRYSRAEPLYRQALGILERTDGPHSTALLPALEKYAAMLRDMERKGEATRLEARAKSIRGSARQG